MESCGEFTSFMVFPLLFERSAAGGASSSSSLVVVTMPTRCCPTYTATARIRTPAPIAGCSTASTRRTLDGRRDRAKPRATPVTSRTDEHDATASHHRGVLLVQRQV